MLEDERFRRTARCGYFTKLLAGHNIPAYKNEVESLSVSRFGEQGFDKPIVVKGESSRGNLRMVCSGDTMIEESSAISWNPRLEHRFDAGNGQRLNRD